MGIHTTLSTKSCFGTCTHFKHVNLCQFHLKHILLGGKDIPTPCVSYAQIRKWNISSSEKTRKSMTWNLNDADGAGARASVPGTLARAGGGGGWSPREPAVAAPGPRRVPRTHACCLPGLGLSHGPHFVRDSPLALMSRRPAVAIALQSALSLTESRYRNRAGPRQSQALEAGICSSKGIV